MNHIIVRSKTGAAIWPLLIMYDWQICITVSCISLFLLKLFLYIITVLSIVHDQTAFLLSSLEDVITQHALLSWVQSLLAEVLIVSLCVEDVERTRGLPLIAVCAVIWTLWTSLSALMRNAVTHCVICGVLNNPDLHGWLQTHAVRAL